jgi:ornithine carbamoyltransferase
VIAGYSDAIVGRVFEHELLEGLAEHADIPVINALSDLLHPCQILADAYTIYRHGKLTPNMKIVFIGDGNNVANSWLELAAIIPLHLVFAVPRGYEPNSVIMQKVINDGISTIEIIHDPNRAAKDANVLYTDVWTSMGQEEEISSRQLVFKNYCITGELMQEASPDCMIMHCLPAHRGEEITDEMIVSPQSVIFEEAENRLHIQKALLYYLLVSDDNQDGNTSTTNITENVHEKISQAISYKRDYFTSEYLQSTRARKGA